VGTPACTTKAILFMNKVVVLLPMGIPFAGFLDFNFRSCDSWKLSNLEFLSVGGIINLFMNGRVAMKATKKKP